MKSFLTVHFFFFAFVFFFVSACRHNTPGNGVDSIIADGHAAALAKDNNGVLHLTFCRGDSILYSYSANQGKSFSAPELVAVLPGLASTHARGPQVAAVQQGITIIACNKTGNISSFKKNGSRPWLKYGQVNDRDSAAGEGLMSLSGDSSLLFAVWLDGRDKYTKIYGSSSGDGGQSWSANRLIYASPDSMVCSCCRPSVAVKGNDVYVMFRNLIAGNRDLYLTHSEDGGKNFGHAEKLGNGSWKLNGCPMDGGALVISSGGQPETIWRREDKIYSCEPGSAERELAVGHSCTMASAGDQDIYVWTDSNQVISQFPGNKKQMLGKGSLPVVKAFRADQFICVWENEKQIHATVLTD